MDAIEAIMTRRSIRKYTKDAVSDELIEKLLGAAMSAPSAGNQQVWRFVVITEREILDEIPKYHPHSKMLKDAPLAILVCGDLEAETRKGFWIQDCAAATENILIAANALGLGAVWLGVYPREERVVGIKKVLGLPEHIIPLSLIPIGHPAQNFPPSERFDGSKVHYNGWSK